MEKGKLIALMSLRKNLIIFEDMRKMLRENSKKVLAFKTYACGKIIVGQ
jgi:hypothetical protein